MTIKKVMVIFGTRPEAIKMAPVVHALRKHRQLVVRTVITGQHRQMLDQVLRLFDIAPDANLDVMRQGQSLADLSARILQGIAPLLERERPDIALVHGDTTTAIGAALAAFYAKVPVAHVEAGLRSGNPISPWPEEMNRAVVARLSAVHFAPTSRAAQNLVNEGIHPGSIHVTGNTVIDALLQASATLHSNHSLRIAVERMFSFLSPKKRLVLVTSHRRESHGAGIERICRAVARLSARTDVEVVYSVHPNPSIQRTVRSMLSGRSNVHLLEPQDYLPFVYLMNRCHIILTDSGGIQEEAPSLGKPVLVLREQTERTEALESGTVVLVGTDEASIVNTANRLLDDHAAYTAMTTINNPYGDGKASSRIAELLIETQLTG
ncbi:UDP-N-acetylglucosamine 2-epimerase (non-hydrolyzing) [Lysobacter sp. GX 14042]|uniref:non-hydrolyzing UDP-N-acetylglucosamine 2-epimerase n=1 Tax=Lysobacter sp. GX 14042 TaxID=2907155 RepID=UPI001F22A99D|nr:UDP-N-acetylglucosamine 2-epimerase (non-hydrolyzing) [Lysobacter sp. GX 14042]MCE7032789.1 UDP-N-acetylglucosamine 2-epimerase (non-hydrolyzing) [Lysobacter sp. GX 14042]